MSQIKLSAKVEAFAKVDNRILINYNYETDKIITEFHSNHFFTGYSFEIDNCYDREFVAALLVARGYISDKRAADEFKELILDLSYFIEKGTTRQSQLHHTNTDYLFSTKCYR